MWTPQQARLAGVLLGNAYGRAVRFFDEYGADRFRRRYRVDTPEDVYNRERANLIADHREQYLQGWLDKFAENCRSMGGVELNKSGRMAEEKMLELIDCYCAFAERMLIRLKKSLAVQGTLLGETRAGNISTEDVVNGITYQVHGGGVRISDGVDSVDIELGENDFTGAFDAWRVSRFAGTKPEYKMFSETDKTGECLSDLLSMKKIIPYPYLGPGFYCKPDGKKNE